MEAINSAKEELIAQDSPLSKNAQKRLLKAAKRTDLKLERRAKEKEARKAKKRARALESHEDNDGPEPAAKKAQPARTPFDATVIIDLGFDDLMSQKVPSAI
jgi:tRNA (guanine9-N1)-methyltransferase